MTTDDLAGLEALLAEHRDVRWHDAAQQWVCTGCGALMGTQKHTPALRRHQAAVIAAAGWAKGREEWGVRDGEDVDEIEPPTRERAERVTAANNAHLRRNGMEGESVVVRRYVTDWEEVPRET